MKPAPPVSRMFCGVYVAIALPSREATGALLRVHNSPD
jgi:hypothetical protein